MKKFWRVAWHEYSRHVFRKRFLFALLSVPLMILFMVILVIGMIMMETSSKPVGYIDYSGLLSEPIAQPQVKWPDQSIPMIGYMDETIANDDLQGKKIQAYYIIPQNYLQTGQAKIIYLDKYKGSVEEQFTSFLKANLLADQPPEIANRILDGSKVIVRSTDKSREASQERFVNIILPFLAGILFIVAISTTSGYLLQAVVEEKENRTMEIMVTSVSPGQMMTGKVLADICIGVTQLVVWGLFLVLVLVFGGRFIPSLSGFHFSTEVALVLVIVMVPAFIMVSGLIAALGATVTEGSEGQQIMGLVSLPIWLPFMLTAMFIENPNSPLAVALSLFPLTAPTTIALRIGFTTIPTWQIIASVTILIVSATGAVWLAGRATRLGMLRYGQRLRLKEIFSQRGG